MHVFAEGSEVAAATADEQRFVTAAENMTGQLVAAIESECVSSKEPFHPGDQVGFRSLHDEMEVISEETPSVNLPVGLCARVSEGRNKSFPILVVEEDLSLPVAAAHEMIQGTWELNA